MRQSRKIRSNVTPTFAFVVDGETEIWYLQMLKRNERQLRLNIKPEIPNKKSIEEQFKLVEDLSESEYPKVFWLVDLDTIIKESRETPKGKKTPLRAFLEIRKVIKRDYKNVIIVINNPCLEFWFLLHFEKTSKLFDTCAKAESELKKHLKDYEKTQKHFTKQDNDIYLKLKPLLKTAISNSESLGQFDMDEQTKAICEMYLLFQTDELKKIL
ncbi:RloB family protein [uncultured Roseivirga sp.]|uniref:RloB family protein n=1 Tax=uncultured Roseivirga sp. TaxID=543088 RepID=UPI0030D7190D|tara:strand:- start:48459 stop:49097 length:639 start_codon:yes stop_codon:yes gene_type:complete